MNDFEDQLKVILRVRNLQPRTVEIYLSHLRRYQNWCYSHGVMPEDMPTEALVQWMSEAKSASAKNQRRAMLVNLYEFVLGQGHKTIHLPYPKKRVRLPHSLTPQEVGLLLDQITNKKHRLLLQVMYALGLRVSELVRIKKEDLYKRLDVQTRTHYYELCVIGKGSKERRISVPDQTALALLEHIRYSGIESGYIFRGQFKSHYSEKSVQTIFKRVKEAAGINTPGNTHLLRKSRATHLLNAQMNDRSIMLMFGWNQQKTIDHYHQADTSSMHKSISLVDSVLVNEVPKLTG